MTFLALWVIAGAFAAYVASQKGRNGAAWFMLGLVFGVFALIAVAGLPAQAAAPKVDPMRNLTQRSVYAMPEGVPDFYEPARGMRRPAALPVAAESRSSDWGPLLAALVIVPTLFFGLVTGAIFVSKASVPAPSYAQTKLLISQDELRAQIAARNN